MKWLLALSLIPLFVLLIRRRIRFSLATLVATLILVGTGGWALLRARGEYLTRSGWIRYNGGLSRNARHAYCDGIGGLEIFSVGRAKPIRELPIQGGDGDVAFSPDGKMLAAARISQVTL